MTRILLVHGLGGDVDTWDAVRAELHRRMPAADVTCPTLPDDFEAAVDLAAQWMMAGPGVVVGHSMGGHVSLRAARAVKTGHPLVLLAPGGVGPAPPAKLVWAVWSRAVLARRSPDDFERAMRSLYADRQHPVATQRALYHRTRAVPGPERERWLSRVVTHVEGVLAGWIGDARDTPGRLWVVRGEADPMVSTPPLKALGDGHPRGAFAEWPAVGHMLPDEAPARVVELITRAVETL